MHDFTNLDQTCFAALPFWLILSEPHCVKERQTIKISNLIIMGWSCLHSLHHLFDFGRIFN